MILLMCVCDICLLNWFGGFRLLLLLRLLLMILHLCSKQEGGEPDATDGPRHVVVPDGAQSSRPGGKEGRRGGRGGRRGRRGDDDDDDGPEVVSAAAAAIAHLYAAVLMFVC